MTSVLVLSSIIFVAMLSPGPDFLLVVKNSLTRSRREAYLTALGIAFGCLVHATYCILGLAVILKQSVVLFTAIKIAGGCYIAWLGLSLLRSAPSRSLQEVEAEALNHDRKGSGQHPFVEGVLCNLLNPKLAVFLLSLFTQFLSPEASFSEKLLVASIFVGESLLYWPLLVFFLQSRQVQFGFARFQHLADRVFGALLLGVGIRVALSDR